MSCDSVSFRAQVWPNGTLFGTTIRQPPMPGVRSSTVRVSVSPSDPRVKKQKRRCRKMKGLRALPRAGNQTSDNPCLKAKRLIDFAALCKESPPWKLRRRELSALRAETFGITVRQNNWNLRALRFKTLDQRWCVAQGVGLPPWSRRRRL